jgi:hypothetical protein
MSGNADLRQSGDLSGLRDMPGHIHMRPGVHTDDARHSNMLRVYDVPGKHHLSRNDNLPRVRDVRGDLHLSRHTDLSRASNVRGVPDMRRLTDVRGHHLQRADL